MAVIHLGSDSNTGGRKYNEDRCGIENITTPAGLQLAVGIVCDGVGGEERGERAAQIAVDTALAYLRQSDVTDIPQLISNAMKAANGAAFAEAQRLGAGERMACTMVMALIVNGRTLHIGNAGDSRIYLSRGGKLMQLTRDHTYANVMVWMGKLTPEAAAAHPEGNRVMRVLGPKDNVQADQGIYLTTTDYGDANRLGRAGFALQQGDSIVLCSDGLVKNTATTGQPLVNAQEIVNITQTQEGAPAARAIMGIALGRIPVGEAVDNITVAVLQTEDPARAVNQVQNRRNQQEKQQREQRRRMALAAIWVAIPLGGLLVVTLVSFGFVYYWMQGNVAATATQLAQATSIALAETETVAAFTATPTLLPPTATPTLSPTPVPTTVPTLVSGEIAKLFDETKFLNVILDSNQKILAAPSDGLRLVVVNHKGKGPNADLHLRENSQIKLSLVIDPKVQIKLLTGSDLFIQSGPYANGVEVELVGNEAQLSTRGCLAIRYISTSQLKADCFSGSCPYTLRIGDDPTTFTQHLEMDLLKLSVQPAVPISPQDDLAYWQLLRRTDAGRQDIPTCHVAPPPTPRPTLTPTAPRSTDTPEATGSSPVTGGSTPEPPPSAAPSATLSPMPQPSDTNPPPPSSTPPPPSATPQPSDTPVPPSNTPGNPPSDCNPFGSNGKRPTCTPPGPTLNAQPTEQYPPVGSTRVGLLWTKPGR